MAFEQPNWAEAVLAAAITAIGWLFKRHLGRLDRLERICVRKQDFDELADTVRSDVSALHERIDRKFDEQNRKFDEQTRHLIDILRDRRQ